MESAVIVTLAAIMVFLMGVYVGINLKDSTSPQEPEDLLSKGEQQ